MSGKQFSLDSRMDLVQVSWYIQILIMNLVAFVFAENSINGLLNVIVNGVKITNIIVAVK